MPLGASWTLLASLLEPLGSHGWLLRILLGISWGGLGSPWTSYGITWASLWAPLGSWGVSYLILLQADLRQFGVWKRLCAGFGSIVSELMLLGSLLEPLGSLGRLMGTLLVISWEGAWEPFGAS